MYANSTNAAIASVVTGSSLFLQRGEMMATDAINDALMEDMEAYATSEKAKRIMGIINRLAFFEMPSFLKKK